MDDWLRTMRKALGLCDDEDDETVRSALAGLIIICVVLATIFATSNLPIPIVFNWMQRRPRKRKRQR